MCIICECVFFKFNSFVFIVAPVLAVVIILEFSVILETFVATIGQGNRTEHYLRPFLLPYLAKLIGTLLCKV